MSENDFEIKQYRIEWVVEVYAVDQYGIRNTNIAPTYSRGWATREQAQLDVEAISVPHEYVVGRRVAKMAHNQYHAVGIFYREVLIDNPTDIQPTTPEGWKLVPVEPTRKMESAAEDYWNSKRFGAFSSGPRTWEGIYATMLEAAPKFGEEE